MRYGIGAAGIVLRERELLLVRHREAGAFDFWLPPGGKLEGEESIRECAEREVREETGLVVRAGRILYVQEFVHPGYHFVKFFLLCEEAGGSLSLEHRVAEERDFLVDARFFPPAELRGLDVRPPVLRDAFWCERHWEGLESRYLGLERAEE